MFMFQDKPWVYAHLLEIQRRVGRENFPLIDQVFYPSHRDMVSGHILFPELLFLFRITREITPASSRLATLMEAWAKSELRTPEDSR